MPVDEHKMRQVSGWSVTLNNLSLRQITFPLHLTESFRLFTLSSFYANRTHLGTAQRVHIILQTYTAPAMWPSQAVNTHTVIYRDILGRSHVFAFTNTNAILQSKHQPQYYYQIISSCATHQLAMVKPQPIWRKHYYRALRLWQTKDYRPGLLLLELRETMS